MKKAKKNEKMKKNVLISSIVVLVLVLVIVFSSLQSFIFNPIDESDYALYYDFDEGNANDLLINNNGTATGVTFNQEGYLGNGIYLNGGTNRIWTGNALDVFPDAGSSSATFGAWVKFDSVVSDKYQLIFMHGDGGGLFLRFGIDTTGHPYYWWYNSGSAIIGDTPIEADTWYYFSATAGSENVLYVNGEAVGSSNGKVLVYQNGRDVYIGTVNSQMQSIKGYVDEVMIVRRAISSTEMSELYNQYLQGIRPIANEITINLESTNGGSAIGSGIYVEGLEVIINATPDEGYIFTNWTGDYTGDEAVANIYANSDMNITANFEEGFIYYLADEESKTCSEVFILSSEVTENHYSSLKDCEKFFADEVGTITGYTISVSESKIGGFFGRIWNWIIDLFN